MKATSVFTPTYLKHADLNDQPHLVYIERVLTRHDVLDPRGQGEVTRHVLYLLNAPKGFMLDFTQTEAVVAATGQDDTDNWPGHALILNPIINQNGYPSIEVTAFDPATDSPEGYAQFAPRPQRALPTGRDVSRARATARPVPPPPWVGQRVTEPAPAPLPPAITSTGDRRSRRQAHAAAN